jgi:hypothetical protein
MTSVSYDQYRTECCNAADENDSNAMRCGALLRLVMRWSGGREGFNVSDRIHPSREKAWHTVSARHQLY